MVDPEGRLVIKYLASRKHLVRGLKTVQFCSMSVQMKLTRRQPVFSFAFCKQFAGPEEERGGGPSQTESFSWLAFTFCFRVAPQKAECAV